MSTILVNNEYPVEGEFSFSVSYDDTQRPPIRSINGVFSCKAGYLPEITSLENDRYVLTGIHVHQEDFGSEENTMLYHFEAKAFGMADELKEVKLIGSRQ